MVGVEAAVGTFTRVTILERLTLLCKQRVSVAIVTRLIRIARQVFTPHSSSSALSSRLDRK